MSPLLISCWNIYYFGCLYIYIYMYCYKKMKTSPVFRDYYNIGTRFPILYYTMGVEYMNIKCTLKLIWVSYF